MKIIKQLLNILPVLILLVIIFLSTIVIEENTKIQTFKKDYEVLHSPQYGMFNSDIWLEKIKVAIDIKIEEFQFNASNKEEIRTYIETILNTIIIEADRIVRKHNKGQRGFFDSILGSTKQMITDSIIDIKALQKRVPEFTDAVILEAERPENQVKAKNLVREKLKLFIQERFKSTMDISEYSALFKKYDANSYSSCSIKIDNKIQEISSNMNALMYSMLGLSLLLILLILMQGNLTSLSLFTLSGTTLSLLITGIMTPMLDIEAKIENFSFSILDQSIIFEDQILFFKSKSISNLVESLLQSGEGKMIFVGILLTLFSVIFPTLKLLSSYLYFYSSSRIGNNPVTRFFVLRSTKWSMADVMVVSIFMSYLGLDGVISGELAKLESTTTAVNIISTNGTHLELGFYLFLGFVLTSFALSLLIEKSKK